MTFRPRPMLPPTDPAAEAPAAPRGLGRDLLGALRGTARDYTEGPIGTALLLLAVPMGLEMAMESVFAVVDVYWVASLGAPAVAAVRLTESVLSLMYAVAMGLSIAATAVVAAETVAAVVAAVLFRRGRWKAAVV